jgi:hypothetical protein
MAKKYRFEVFFCGAFILATVFSKIFDLMGYCILLTAIGAVLGMVLPSFAEKILHSILSYVCKQERVTQIIIGVILLAIAVILSPLIFLMIGLFSGKAMHRDTVMHKGKNLHGADVHDDEGSGHS